MSNSDALYHLGFGLSDIAEFSPKTVLLSGDPGRAKVIATETDGVELVKVLSENRGLNSYLCKVAERFFLSCTSGMGAPSSTIVVNELCQLGIEEIVRVGTCGSISPKVRAGEVVISSAAVSRQGAVLDLVPEGYPCAADPHLVVDLATAAARAGLVASHVGLTCSTDTFFEGQERISSSVNKHLVARNRGLVEELRNLNVLNFEMEAASLFAQGLVYGFKAGAVCAVLAERIDGEDLVPDIKHSAVEDAISVVIQYLIDKKEDFDVVA